MPIGGSVDWPGRWMQDRLGYEPRDLALFRAALTHRSASGANNERLEFLGDAVLNLVIAHHLYAAFPLAAEGDLSRSPRWHSRWAWVRPCNSGPGSSGAVAFAASRSLPTHWKRCAARFFSMADSLPWSR